MFRVCCAINTPANHPKWVTKYIDNVGNGILLGFEYPMKWRDIGKFENKYDGWPSMSINVYDLDSKF